MKSKNFATSWEALAQLISQRLNISVTSQAIWNWRHDPRYKEHWPRPKSGRHDVRKWTEFMVRFGLKCADEAIKPEDLPKERWTIREWKEHREKLMCEKIQFEIETEKKKHVPLDEICAAVGQMLAGFRTAINMLPGSAARWLIGLKDFHAIKAKLENEVDGVLRSLGRCKYIEFEPCEKCAPHFIELGKESLKELRIDVGEQPNAPESR